MPHELRYAGGAVVAGVDQADEPTALDAGRFLAWLWDRTVARPPDRLLLSEAVERLREEFGGRFLVGQPGNLAIDATVLEAFRRRVGPTVVFDPGERGWRWRQGGDVPDGQQWG